MQLQIVATASAGMIGVCVGRGIAGGWIMQGRNGFFLRDQLVVVHGIGMGGINGSRRSRMMMIVVDVVVGITGSIQQCLVHRQDQSIAQCRSCCRRRCSSAL